MPFRKEQLQSYGLGEGGCQIMFLFAHLMNFDSNYSDKLQPLSTVRISLSFFV